MELLIIQLFGAALAWLLANSRPERPLEQVRVPRDDAEWDRLLTELNP